jgi:HD superfamily phosphohydrolase
MQGLCLSIIDTKEFQRLRKLMQLGTCSYVFYGATHTRFEHSIGVSHFAGMVARNLQASQPYLGITEEDILCVKVAGLCHDLGHGPFSHVFDGVFIPRIVPDTTWRHEDGSVQMLKYLLNKNRIDHREYELTDRDLLFIEEIIAGTKEADRRGRGYEKFYLYDIVNNSRSGLDVDKLDYFMRDMRYTNASSSTCNFQRFIELGRVFAAEPIQRTAMRLSGGGGGGAGLEEDGGAEREHFMICYPEKMVKEALDVFAVRFRLHQTIYTHKSVKKVEFMVRLGFRLV